MIFPSAFLIISFNFLLEIIFFRSCWKSKQNQHRNCSTFFHFESGKTRYRYWILTSKGTPLPAQWSIYHRLGGDVYTRIVIGCRLAPQYPCVHTWQWGHRPSLPGYIIMLSEHYEVSSCTVRLVYENILIGGSCWKWHFWTFYTRQSNSIWTLGKMVHSQTVHTLYNILDLITITIKVLQNGSGLSRLCCNPIPFHTVPSHEDSFTCITVSSPVRRLGCDMHTN